MRKTAIAGLALVAYAASTDAFSMGGARIPFTSTSVARSTCASNRPATWVSQQRKVALRSAAPGVRMQATIQQTNVAMPALSSTMTEGKIVQWTKSVGDKVSAGDILMVVESDKADMDVESFEDGYLAAILVEDGESAAVGSTVAIIVPNKSVLSQSLSRPFCFDWVRFRAQEILNLNGN
jgi:biotin carboxyl carrier protein